MFTVRLSHTAKQDIIEQITWYNRCRSGLGADFLLCVEEAIDRICDHPDAYPITYKGLRRILIRRFPFAVFYRMEMDIITILAILHCRRNEPPSESL